jgi:RNA polymerase primary sigma factor
LKKATRDAKVKKLEKEVKAAKEKFAAAPKKTMTKERKALEHKLSQLVTRGRDRGFITYDEILRVFPEIENNVDFLDEIYERMGGLGVDILESGGLLDAEPIEDTVPSGASRKSKR